MRLPNTKNGASRLDWHAGDTWRSDPKAELKETCRVIAEALETAMGNHNWLLSAYRDIAFCPEFQVRQICDEHVPSGLTLDAIQTMFMVSGIDVVDTILWGVPDKNLTNADTAAVYHRRWNALSHHLPSHSVQPA